MYNFNQYKEKLASRSETIIELFQDLFSLPAIPGDYLTLCAQQTNDGKNLSEGSELKQLLENRTLDPKQFYGIDTDPEVIALNKKTGVGNWVHSDIFSYLEKNIDKLSPSVINLDTLFYSKKSAIRLLSNILLLLTDHTETQCLVTLNVAVNNPYSRHSLTKDLLEEENDKLIDCLESNLDYTLAVNEGRWKFLEKSFLYSSTGRTLMRTYCFYRN